MPNGTPYTRPSTDSTCHLDTHASVEAGTSTAGADKRPRASDLAQQYSMHTAAPPTDTNNDVLGVGNESSDGGGHRTRDYSCW
ncbi:hypothetical protein PI124_g1939 [Phytophthora idaei]|nr:hypothetical protein PI125_g3958 [Phytophthora idaei]KAG3160178.1 hypothetical protein PI126_g7010 [Phytophthora idaei]KAG3253420.1 hypothetical protein PI124_g1939 [Phytophthora idaei]